MMTNDKFTPDAKAEADTEQASAGSGAVGVGSTTHAGQTQAGTGTVQTGFTETGHAQLSDTNVQELISGASGLLSIAAASANALTTQSAATLKSVLDSVQATRAQNAALVDHMVSTNAQHLNNLVNSASHRHSEIAADRQWNLDEQPAWFTVLLESVAEIVNKDKA